MSTVLITGANRGLGLEFCRQYAQAGWQVYACCRQPQQASSLAVLAQEYPQLQIKALDVANPEQMAALAAELHALPVDVLIANAGVYGDQAGKGFGYTDYAAWQRTMETNVFAVMRLAEHFISPLQASDRGLLVAISSLMGSMADNSSGGSYLYRSSKAALNAVMKSLAIDFQATGLGALILHPGWVRTDMGGPHGLIDAQTSVSGMRQVIADFDLTQTGHFIKYDGSPMPW